MSVLTTVASAGTDADAGTDATARARDPYLDIALDGLQLIEASAGTGKTYTLATLVTRLVIERGLRVGQVLAVTFTEAATQELRERLRLRLQLAARLAAAGDAVATGDAEAALTAQLIAAQRTREPAEALRRRLQRAAHEIDLAAVFTIHGFCARVLAEHALDTRQAFAAPQMVGSDRDLRDEVAADLWRQLASEPASAELLAALWSGPDALAQDLGALLRAPTLLPAPPQASDDPLPALQRAAQTLRTAFAEHGDHARAALDAAVAGKVLNGNSYRASLPGELWRALAAWAAQPGAVGEIDPRLDRLTPACLEARSNKGKAALVPQSPLFAAVAGYLDALAVRALWLQAQSVAFVHGVRELAARHLQRLKQLRGVQTFDDLIDDVADALAGDRGDALAAALRAQYPVALVDEFQDTDPRQWGIFERVFGRTGDDGTPPALFLIGDPKQAIYRFRGGDVHTYLAARAQAQEAPALAANFRSRPALLRAIERLYARAGDDAFVDPRIGFRAVQAGGRVVDADFRRDGAVAPALTVRVLPAPTDDRRGNAWSAPESRTLATRACVAAIHALLRDAADGAATLRAGGIERAVRAGDIAVLVRSHAEAAHMQAALAAVGIPAVAAGRQSLFATAQAMELLAVFDALLQPGDDARLRAALASVLIGLDAHAIQRLDDDAGWHRHWQAQAMAWRERWQRHGPLALVADLCAAHAPRLLALVDGERRLTNLLQLGEALQEADARALGVQGLVDWLRLRILEADPDDETQQLRLESDAQRVQILTLHKSKGLEFALVYLPFAGIGREPRNGRWCEFTGDDGRVLHLHADDAAREAWRREERAEEARLLYVGLTRARHALWLAAGPLYNAASAPLNAMLGDPAGLATGDDARLLAVEADGLPPARLPPLSTDHATALPPARQARRVLARDWWVYSFTQLSNESTGDGASNEATGSADARSEAAATPLVAAVAGERAADDEPELATAALASIDPRFGGSRFGNVLHTALENVDFGAWRDWRGNDAAPPGQDAPLRAALRGEGYAQADLDDGVAQLTALVGHTVTVALPEGARLCDLPREAARAEMEFHFAMQPTTVPALLAVLHAHGVVPSRQAFGLRRRLEGLMTGKIDLVYGHGGRHYVLDYKSNRLPDYGAGALEQAMADSEYTLQALIYTVALHRWLRFRLGAHYDYARDFGGVRYLFCRGLDAADPASPGVFAQQPAPALVHALDELFAQGSAP